MKKMEKPKLSEWLKKSRVRMNPLDEGTFVQLGPLTDIVEVLCKKVEELEKDLEEAKSFKSL